MTNMVLMQFLQNELGNIITIRVDSYNPFGNKTPFVTIYYKTGCNKIITIRVDSYNPFCNTIKGGFSDFGTQILQK